MRRAMKFKYIYALLTLIIALYFVPATAQTKHKSKKPAAKTVAKKAAARPAAKKTAPAPQKSTTRLGDAVAKAAADTTKKGGKGNDAIQGNLSEEIVVTTAYKP